MVIKAYEDSIRQQEEARLRVKKQSRMKELAAEESSEFLLLEVRPSDGRPPASPVYFSRIALERDGQVDRRAAAWTRRRLMSSCLRIFKQEGSNWGEATVWQGRDARALQNFGSPFHRVAGVLALPRSAASGATLAIDYWADARC